MKGRILLTIFAFLFSTSVFAHLPDDDIAKTIDDPGMIPASPQKLHQQHKKHAKAKHHKRSHKSIHHHKQQHTS